MLGVECSVLLGVFCRQLGCKLLNLLGVSRILRRKYLGVLFVDGYDFLRLGDQVFGGLLKLLAQLGFFAISCLCKYMFSTCA